MMEALKTIGIVAGVAVAASVMLAFLHYALIGTLLLAACAAVGKAARRWI